MIFDLQKRDQMKSFRLSYQIVTAFHSVKKQWISAVIDIWKSQEGQAKYTFSTTKEERCINDNLNCKSKNLIYLIECKKCTKRYIGETKRQLHERFGEHRRSIQNHHQLIKPTPVSAHFNQPGHSIDHLLLTSLELIHSKRDSVRKAREAHLINKAMTLKPLGINRRDEQN